MVPDRPSAGRRARRLQRRLHRGRGGRRAHALRAGRRRPAHGQRRGRRPHRRHPQPGWPAPPPRRPTVSPARLAARGRPRGRLLPEPRRGRPARRARPRWPPPSATTACRSGRWSRRTRRATAARLVFLTHLAREGDVRATLGRPRASSTRSERIGGVMRIVGGRRDRRAAGTGPGGGSSRSTASSCRSSAGTPVVTLLEGGTPLLEAPRLSARVGARVLLKVEGANPTGSFKDRGHDRGHLQGGRGGGQGGGLRLDRQHVGLGGRLRAPGPA